MKSDTFKQRIKNVRIHLQHRLLSPEFYDSWYMNMLGYPRFLAFFTMIMSMIGVVIAATQYDNAYFVYQGYINSITQGIMPFAYEWYLTALRGKF